MRIQRSLLTSALLAAATAAALATGCGSGGPRTAAQIVSGDGYGTVQTATAAQLATVNASGLITTDVAAGTRGSNGEAVVILTPAGVTEMTMFLPTARAADPAVTFTLAGTVLTVDGPASVFHGGPGSVFGGGGQS